MVGLGMAVPGRNLAAHAYKAHYVYDIKDRRYEKVI